MYSDILRRLKVVVRRKRPENRTTNGWFLFHSNAPAHRSVLAKDFLAKNNVTALKHPPYFSHWLQLCFTCSLDWYQQRNDGAFVILRTSSRMRRKCWKDFYKRATRKVSNTFIPYPTAFPYGNGMVLQFYQQQDSSTTKTVHKVINKGLKAYV